MSKRVIPLFLPLLLLISCAGMQDVLKNTPFAKKSEQPPAGPGSTFFTSMPVSGGLVFIGAAGKRSDPKETLQYALEDAARHVALFNNVYGEYGAQNTVGSGLIDYVNDTFTSIKYDAEGSARYVEALQFNEKKDTMEIDNTFFVRTVYPSALSAPVKYRPSYGANEKPDWVDNPPFEIEGYDVGIGFSGRHSLMADTYNNSCKNAIFSIIRKINTSAQSKTVLFQDGSTFGNYTSHDNITYSFGTLTGFYVLDTWVDTKEKTVWTLAIAKKTN